MHEQVCTQFCTHDQTIFAFKMPSFYTYWFENRGVPIFGFEATKEQTRVWHFV